MNIGQLMRGLVGEMHAAEPKSVELKVGQVVRGVILQLMSETEAMVNIGGVPVRARLETPMAQGQVTLLQVQPESVGGQVVLKPLEASGVQIAERSLPELLKGFEMKDTPANRRALQELHQGQAPIVKDNVKAYAEVRGTIPEGVDESQWKEAAILAVKRGLPVTQETVGSLHRALFGKPMDQSLRAMASLVSEALAPEGGAAPLPAPVRALVAQIRQVIDNLPNLPAQPPAASGSGEAAGAAARPLAQAAGAGAAAGSAGTAPVRGAVAQPAAGATAAAAGQPGAAGASAGGDAHAAAAAPQARGAAPAAELGAALGRSSSASAAGRADAGAAAAPQAAPAAGGAAAAHAHAQQEPAEWIGRLLKALGVEHEQQLARLTPRDGADLPPLHKPADGDFTPSGATAAPQPVDAEQADTLKGLLLQLSGTDGAPSALKEGAQQLVQQITGQQLLLTPDRTSMFTHMTLMLPLHNENGSQTASVHIQSRKGSRGELDSTNCRLLFDLNMRTMGNTLVDVQVTERIVSLRIHNDFPVIGELLEEHRDEIKSGLEQIGYQFLSLKVLPYPEPANLGAAGTMESVNGTGGSPASRAANLYHAKPYKGVDLRV